MATQNEREASHHEIKRHALQNIAEDLIRLSDILKNRDAFIKLVSEEEWLNFCRWYSLEFEFNGELNQSWSNVAVANFRYLTWYVEYIKGELNRFPKHEFTNAANEQVWLIEKRLKQIDDLLIIECLNRGGSFYKTFLNVLEMASNSASSLEEIAAKIATNIEFLLAEFYSRKPVLREPSNDEQRFTMKSLTMFIGVQSSRTVKKYLPDDVKRPNRGENTWTIGREQTIQFLRNVIQKSLNEDQRASAQRALESVG